MKEQMTQGEVDELETMGYNPVDVLYLLAYGFTFNELMELSPRQVSKMSDDFAALDDNLLGC